MGSISKYFPSFSLMYFYYTRNKFIMAVTLKIALHTLAEKHGLQELTDRLGELVREQSAVTKDKDFDSVLYLLEKLTDEFIRLDITIT